MNDKKEEKKEEAGTECVLQPEAEIVYFDDDLFPIGMEAKNVSER